MWGTQTQPVPGTGQAFHKHFLNESVSTSQFGKQLCTKFLGMPWPSLGHPAGP